MRACPMQCFARDYIENLVRVLLSTGKERWVLALQDRYHQLCAVNLPYFYLTLLTRTVTNNRRRMVTSVLSVVADYW